MDFTGRNQRVENARRELLLLLLASFACVIVLTVGIAGHSSPDPRGFQIRHLIIAAAIIAAAIAATGFVWQALGRARRTVERAQAELASLRQDLLTAESIIKGEPQVLIYWEEARGFAVVAHTLQAVRGLPVSPPELLRFGAWLEPNSAHELKAGLDTLFDGGRPFNLLLKTQAGGHAEADGRAIGGRAVVRFRDVAGHKRDLIRILDRHRQFARDIRSSHALLNALPLPVWLKGADGKIEWANASYVAAVEASDLPEVRERQIELLESAQRAAVARALAKGGRFIQRMQLVIGGERKPHDVVVLPVEGASAAAAIDVTALETAQGELDRQIAAYDRTLDRVATAVAIFGSDQRLAFHNAAYRNLWQLDAAWLDQHPTDGEILDRLRELARLPDVIDYRKWKTDLLAAYRSGGEIEDWWHLPDGRMIHLFAEPRPEGGVTYLYDDATERLALESRHNTLVHVQKETLDSLKEGVAVFGPDGRLKLFNSAFAAIWRLARPVLLEGPHIEEIIRQTSPYFGDNQTWRMLATAVTEIKDERAPITGQMNRRDASILEFAASPLSDGATVVAFSDITAAKRSERLLLERNDALVAADRLKSQFIGHVSYELRTPLTNIIGFSELLTSPRTGPLTEKQREYLSDISASSRTLLSIIDDILDLATIDAGALELKLAPIDVPALVEGAVYAVRDRANRARVKITVSIARDVLDFSADEGRVRQVLHNLLLNAIAFSKPGGTISVSCRGDGDFVAFSVIDEGAGIPEDQQKRVFDRFVSRGRGSRNRGAGLGLSLVKSLVELHGGEMTLASEPGRGTCVAVRLPLQASPEQAGSMVARA